MTDMNYKERKEWVERLGLKPNMTVRLRRDVDNPKADRRTAYDWTKSATIAAGTRLRVQSDFDGDGNISGVHFWRRGGGSCYMHDELFAALLPAVEVVPRTVHELLDDENADADTVLTRLVKDGVLSMEQVQVVAKVVADEAAAKEDAAAGVV